MLKNTAADVVQRLAAVVQPTLVCDERSSHIIFRLFFSHFSYGLTQITEVLEQLFMVYGIFCNVFISRHVILVFPETKQFLGVFDVIQCKIMQIGKAKHLIKTLEDNK